VLSSISFLDKETSQKAPEMERTHSDTTSSTIGNMQKNLYFKLRVFQEELGMFISGKWNVFFNDDQLPLELG
jgi:hypothetical protein